MDNITRRLPSMNAQRCAFTGYRPAKMPFGYDEQSPLCLDFMYMTDDDCDIIMSFPALFMTENHDYGKTDESHMAYWGRVTGISHHGHDTKIKYRIYRSIPQQTINSLADRLCIHGTSCFNELNRTHWAIKRVNLLEEFAEAHIEYFFCRRFGLIVH